MYFVTFQIVFQLASVSPAAKSYLSGEKICCFCSNGAVLHFHYVYRWNYTLRQYVANVTLYRNKLRYDFYR